MKNLQAMEKTLAKKTNNVKPMTKVPMGKMKQTYAK